MDFFNDLINHNFPPFIAPYVILSSACLLSATILPFPSEGFIFYALFKGYSPLWIFLSASFGNCLGSTINYFIGLLCNNYILKKYINIDESDSKIKKAMERIKKYKSPILLLSWIPGIGDPMVIAAGILKMKFTDIIFYSYTGRIIRYVIIILPFAFYKQ
jgi:membrane protein YqaA with SNARE-associated domain